MAFVPALMLQGRWQVAQILLLWAGHLCMECAALGNEGGNHTISILKTQLQQVMEQICCQKNY